MAYQLVIAGCPHRQWMIDELLELFPHALVSLDDDKNPFTTYLGALARAGDDGALVLEDDAIPTSDFEAKADAVIQSRPLHVINFFSIAVDDLRIGARWMTAGRFLRTVCTYYPPGYPRMITALAKSNPDYIDEYSHQYDIFIRKFLMLQRVKYWNHVPNLVDHRVSESLITPFARQRRQSKTFIP